MSGTCTTCPMACTRTLQDFEHALLLEALLRLFQTLRNTCGMERLLNQNVRVRR